MDNLTVYEHRSQDRPLHERIPNSFMIFEFTRLGSGSADGGDQRLEDRCAWAMSAVDPETVKHRETEKSQVDWRCLGVEGFNRVPGEDNKGVIGPAPILGGKFTT